MGALYRLGQLWQAVRAAPLTAAEWATLAATLSPAEVALFCHYGANDRRHCVHVLRTLQREGETDADVLAAALLHDIGKSRLPLNLIERSVVVLMDTLLPGRLAAWGQGEPTGWRRPFVVKMRHPEWGAEMAAAAGSNPRTVALVRHHQDNLDRSKAPAALRPALARLQRADDLH